jgi:hypothetical protein
MGEVPRKIAPAIDFEQQIGDFYVGKKPQTSTSILLSIIFISSNDPIYLLSVRPRER